MESRAFRPNGWGTHRVVTRGGSVLALSIGLLVGSSVGNAMQPPPPTTKQYREASKKAIDASRDAENASRATDNPNIPQDEKWAMHMGAAATHYDAAEKRRNAAQVAKARNKPTSVAHQNRLMLEHQTKMQDHLGKAQGY